MLPRLVQGMGSRDDGTVCWMSANAWVAGEGWTDEPSCVCPVIRGLCIPANDWLETYADRERVIGPILFVPMGTVGGADLMSRRAFACADVAVREWTPMALRAAGMHEQADRLAALPEIVDEATAEAAGAAAKSAWAAETARAAAKSARAAATAAEAARAAATAAEAAAKSARAARAAEAARAAATAAGAAATAATAAEAAGAAAKSAWAAATAAEAAWAAATAAEAAWAAGSAAEHLLVPLILRLCAMGREELPVVRRLEDLVQP